MPYEVEMKFPLPTGSDLTSILHELGAIASKPKGQRDRYFNHPTRDFVQTDEALRLRDEDGTVHLTYKGPKLDTTTKTREEIEIPLGLGEGDVVSLVRILQKLGFREVAVVSKRRQEFLASWEQVQTTLSIDDVDGVGRFIEIEQVASPATLDRARESLARLATHLGLGPGERRSYLELLLDGRER